MWCFGREDEWSSFPCSCNERAQLCDEANVNIWDIDEDGQNKKRHYTENGMKKVTEFKYPEVVFNHYHYRGMIDNHNSLRKHPISLEETWMTTRWPNCVFSFILAVSIVNIQNAASYFLNKAKVDALQSQRLIAQQLIFNHYLLDEQTTRKHRRHGSLEHSLIMVPIFRKFIQGRLQKCKMKYGKWKCTNCPKFVHSYCSCTPGLMFCADCFGDHHAAIAIGVPQMPILRSVIVSFPTPRRLSYHNDNLGIALGPHDINCS